MFYYSEKLYKWRSIGSFPSVELAIEAEKSKASEYFLSDIISTWRIRGLSLESISDFPFIPPYPYRQAKYFGKRFSPQMIMLHSPAKKTDALNYILDPGDGRKVSYHFAWSFAEDDFVQMVPLNRRAYHAGWKWNGKAIGICVPGPNGRDISFCRNQLRRLIWSIELVMHSRMPVTLHRLVEVKKRDPARADIGFMVKLGYKNIHLTKKHGIAFR